MANTLCSLKNTSIRWSVYSAFQVWALLDLVTVTFWPQNRILSYRWQGQFIYQI